MLDSTLARREAARRRRTHTWQTLAQHALGAAFALIVGAGIAVAIIRAIAETAP